MNEMKAVLLIKLLLAAFHHVDDSACLFLGI